jgi:hypothetical protein
MNDNNIDKLFKNNLDNIEYTPSGRVWKGIENKVVFKPFYVIYRKQLIAAAVLLILITTGYFVVDFNGNRTEKQKPLQTVNSRTTSNKKQASNTGINNDVNDGEINNITHKNGTDKTVSKNEEYRLTIQKENSPVANKTTPQQNSSPENVDGLLEQTATVQRQSGVTDNLPALNMKGFFLDYDYNLMDYQPTFEDVLMPYLEKRNNIHIWTGISGSASMVYYPGMRDMASYSAGVDAGIKLGKFYIASGTAYSLVNEEGEYKIDFQSYDSIGYYNKVVSFEINPQNPQQITYKTVKATVYDSVVHVNILNPHFKHKYLSIPLRVGYKFFDKEHFSASIETGMIFSKLLSSDIPEPEFNNPDFNVISVTRKTPDRNTINWQWTLSLNLAYKINNGMSVSVAPAFSKYVSNIYNSADMVLPYTMGIRFGIYYDF